MIFHICGLFPTSTMASSRSIFFPLFPPRGSGSGNRIYFCFYLPPSVNPFTFTIHKPFQLLCCHPITQILKEVAKSSRTNFPTNQIPLKYHPLLRRRYSEVQFFFWGHSMHDFPGFSSLRNSSYIFLRPTYSAMWSAPNKSIL